MLNTDDVAFDGFGFVDQTIKHHTEEVPHNNRAFSLMVCFLRFEF